MLSASESRQALTLVTGAAVGAVQRLLGGLSGSPEVQRADLLEAVPAVIAYYSDGSSALAADFYDDERERASARGRFLAEPVVVDRTEKIRRAVAWAAQPMFEPMPVTPAQRLEEVVQYETASPYRDTITTNRRRDPESVGWRRVASGGCRFCSMLAGRGAVYKADTARFASHPHCHCTAQPVFRSNDTGEEASVLQYVASKRKRTPAEKQALRDHLNGGDSPKPAPSGLAGKDKAWVEHQLRVTEGLKDSQWRTEQLARLRARLSEF